MKTLFVRTALSFAVSLTACGGDAAGSNRLAELEEGMTVAQSLASMGTGPLTATGSDTARLANGYRRLRYFQDGVNYEVVYARDLEGDVKEPLLQAKETPVVFKDGKLLGWGWRFYVDEAMPKHKLPTPLRAIDTMSVVNRDSTK
jgi:hypothetical protein